MKCAKCKSDNLSVVNTISEDDFIKRIRKCLSCCHKETSIEIFIDNGIFSQMFEEFDKIKDSFKRMRRAHRHNPERFKKFKEWGAKKNIEKKLIKELPII